MDRVLSIRRQYYAPRCGREDEKSPELQDGSGDSGVALGAVRYPHALPSTTAVTTRQRRLVVIRPTDIPRLEEIGNRQPPRARRGGQIPFTVIREIVEN